MVGTVRGMVAVSLLVLAGGGTVIAAANVDKAFVETDGRRKAAETGVREIKVKTKDQVDQVRPLYVEAACPQQRLARYGLPSDSARDINRARHFGNGRTCGVRARGLGIREESRPGCRRPHRTNRRLREEASHLGPHRNRQCDLEKQSWRQ
jgi:hypothetical protein